MKVIFLDHDGVICLSSEWGSRHRSGRDGIYRIFDDFNKKAIKVLNEIISETDCEIVISSDWKFHAPLEDMQNLYRISGILKAPIGYTPREVLLDGVSFDKKTELEHQRSLEIKEYLKQHPEITNWVAVDDLDMRVRYDIHTIEYSWGLENFVLIPRSSEGIKQTGIKEKIIKFL